MTYRYTHYLRRTGGTNTLVRSGFSDSAVWKSALPHEFHLLFAITEGPLDAPEMPPTGASMAVGRRIFGDEPHACRFRSCTCGGRGDTVHVMQA